MRRKPLKSAWANVDWSNHEPNAVIAARLGVTEEAVSYHRRAARQNESQKAKRAARGLHPRGRKPWQCACGCCQRWQGSDHVRRCASCFPRMKDRGRPRKALRWEEITPR